MLDEERSRKRSGVERSGDSHLSITSYMSSGSLTMIDVVASVQRESRYFQAQIRPHAPIAELVRQKRQRDELADSLSRNEDVKNAFLRSAGAALQVMQSSREPESALASVAAADDGDSASAVDSRNTPTTALAAFIQGARKKQTSDTIVSTLGSSQAVVGTQLMSSQSKCPLYFPVPEKAQRDMNPANHDPGDDDDDFGPTLPLSLQQRVLTSDVLRNSSTCATGPVATTGGTVHPSQMTKEEYLAQYSRVPRRGESGYTPEQIDEASKLGYVMSGSRNKMVQKYIDGLQKQLHEQQAGKLRLEFLSEKERRLDSSMVEACIRMASESGSSPTSALVQDRKV